MSTELSRARHTDNGVQVMISPACNSSNEPDYLAENSAEESDWRVQAINACEPIGNLVYFLSNASLSIPSLVLTTFVFVGHPVHTPGHARTP